MATDVSAPMPALELLPGSVLTVTLDDAGARITTLNVHGDQPTPDTGGDLVNNTPVVSPFTFGDVAA